MTNAAEIAMLAAAGESETVEFKKTTGQRTEAARTLSAMLNGKGGAVVFGVHPNGTVVGQQVTDKTLEDVTHACGDIHPAYPPSLDRVPLPDRPGYGVLVVRVPSGNARPYQHKGSYYVRSGTSTVNMPAEAELSLVLERVHGIARWELAGADRRLDAIDTDEVLTFRDDAIATSRAPFEPNANLTEVLRALHVLDDERLNRAAIVLFGDAGALGPDYSMLGCQLVAVTGIHLGEEFRDEALVELNAFAALRRAVQFCLDHLASPVRLGGLLAEAGPEIPHLVIREALANAFAHRDYATAGRVQVRVFTDRVEVLSPGGLHFGLTPPDLYRPHGSHPWNPLVVSGLYRRGLVDQLGSGTLRMIRLCAENGTGRPVFMATASSVTCAIPRQGFWLRADGTSLAVENGEAQVLQALAEAPLPRAELGSRLHLSDNETITVLDRLRDYGLVHPEGHGRGARWHLGPGGPPPV